MVHLCRIHTANISLHMIKQGVHNLQEEKQVHNSYIEINKTQVWQEPVKHDATYMSIRLNGTSINEKKSTYERSTTDFF